MVAVVVAASIHFLQPAPPRRIVLASGAEFGMYHRYAQRYREILARHPDRILFGTDFPNIPYEWDRELGVLVQLAERLRHVAGLFPVNHGYEFQIHYRRKG